MMNNSINNMTPAGKAAYQLASRYGLGDFYDIYTGNIIVYDDEADGDVTKDLLRFVVNNEDWVLGHEGWGSGDGGYWFLTSDVNFN